MVCLGNICRSPLAEGILRDKAMNEGITVIVDSCGTSGYHIGEHPDPRSVENAKVNGIDISDLVARKFRIEDFDEFDKIYVMDSSNYSDVIALTKSDKDKEKVDLILNMAFPKSNKNVPDPYFGGEQGFQKVYQLLDEACEKIIEELRS